MFETCHCCDEYDPTYLLGQLHCRKCAITLLQKALDYSARAGKWYELPEEFEDLRPDLIFPDPVHEKPDWTKAWEGVR